MAEVGDVNGGGGGDDTGGGGGGGGASSTPEWLGGLPEELRGDATLARYADVPSLAKAHIEAHKVAKSKVIVPAAEADDAAWESFYNATGRPETADAYGDFGLDPLPDDAGDDAKAARDAMLGEYREAMHKLGLDPRRASAAVKLDMERIAAAEKAFYAKGDEEIAALQKELGADYEPQKQAARSLFRKIFGEEAAPLADELDRKVGSGLLMRGMMKLAKLTGEHGRTDGDLPGDLGGTANAAEQLRTKFADKGWRDKFNSGDAPTVAEHGRLMEAAKKQARKS
jgi:hypothetical protein